MNRTTTAASRGNQQSIVNASAPKERPILFSAPMVRAILEGSKTQTRRIVKPQPPDDHPHPQECMGEGYWWNDDDTDRDDLSFWPSYDNCLPCPYGKEGDRLWVREAWAVHGVLYDDLAPRDIHASTPRGCWEDGDSIWFAADGEMPLAWQGKCQPEQRGKWRPSIHMPRWASRITLEITGVRVERLQDISLGDCMAEGCPFPNIAKETDPIEWFAELWESINKHWDANPWVWVVEFKRV